MRLLTALDAHERRRRDLGQSANALEASQAACRALRTRIARPTTARRSVQTTARYAHLANDPLKRATEVVGGLFAEKRFAASDRLRCMDGDQVSGQQKLDALSLIRDNAR
jgi:hypothetical protein